MGTIFAPVRFNKIDPAASYAIAFSEIPKAIFLGGFSYRLNAVITRRCG